MWLQVYIGRISERELRVKSKQGSKSELADCRGDDQGCDWQALRTHLSLSPRCDHTHGWWSKARCIPNIVALASELTEHVLILQVFVLNSPRRANTLELFTQELRWRLILQNNLAGFLDVSGVRTWMSLSMNVLIVCVTTAGRRTEMLSDNVGA